MHAMPVLIVILCLMAIAYRYYSAFLAAKVAALDDARPTPAQRLADGQNYHPTNKWVLFGHHFAAISGAGPLIGPVLAAQFGYLPGLVWIVVGVCLAGAVQDFLVLAASIRRGGKSLAQIAYQEINAVAGTTAMIAILFIIVIALAGLGIVVVKALGGEAVKYPAGSSLLFVEGRGPIDLGHNLYRIPAGTMLAPPGSEAVPFTSDFVLKSASGLKVLSLKTAQGAAQRSSAVANLPADAVRVVPGSSWGTFTIACTIPIALFVGLYMYKIRPGRVVEASVIGAALTIGATIAGAWVADHPQLAAWFNLSGRQVILAMAVYGFVASVLPVWVLLCPRDYLSSFLKIGTIALLVIGTCVANPRLQAPAINHTFLHGGPVLGPTAGIFPFLFITIMCGSISGFHALVSSGTTPKMIKRESDARTIGYGAMLIEGLVGVVAMIAAASLGPKDYYAMNTDLAVAPRWANQILNVGGSGGPEHLGDYENLTQESLRGRTGGAVTLAVGMAHIFDEAFGKLGAGLRTMWKYWYHFAIMFEALFILTTIDTGTRIGRFLLQEVAGKFRPSLGRPEWVPGAAASTLLVVAGWAYFMNSDSFGAIWSMFGVANQMLAVIALAIVSVVIVNEGRAAYLWVTAGPMLVVSVTTTSAALELLQRHYTTLSTQLANPTPDVGLVWRAILSGGLIVGMLLCAYGIILMGILRVWPALMGENRGRAAVAVGN